MFGPRLELGTTMRLATGSPEFPLAGAARPRRLVGVNRGLVALQRAAGNRAVNGLLAAVQRCGMEQHPGCPCVQDPRTESARGASPEAFIAQALAPTAVAESLILQRQSRRDRNRPGEVAAVETIVAGMVVQREKDPTDLTGTPFESFDNSLKAKLKDRSVFDWGSFPTLATALGEQSNAFIASLARVAAAMAYAPFLWPHVKKIKGGWITDNFGIAVEWSNPGGLAATLSGHESWCRDNPIMALKYHGSTDAFRQIPKTPGAASLHVITAGKTDIHIDAHQPLEGKEKDFPWAGHCNYHFGAWWDHAGDVLVGGGAEDTAVGRYAKARDNINKAGPQPHASRDNRRNLYFDKATHGPKLTQASELLTSIGLRVQKYAAMGKMVGNEWEGDQQMLRDKDTMSILEQAEKLISDVLIEQFVEENQSRAWGL